MQIEEAHLQNPLRHFGYETDDILHTGAFGAVLARAGVGKTSFLVQLALNAMLRGKSVLHIRLDSPVKKINLWYREIFERYCEHHKLPNRSQLWESILPNRFIMTFQVDSFSVPRLVERLKDLTEQDIFNPDLLIIDGYDFDEQAGEVLSDLKHFAADEAGLHAWFSIRTHRHQEPDAEGLPVQLSNVKDLFETVIQLQPEGPEIHVSALRGGNVAADKSILRIDPATMLLLDS